MSIKELRSKLEHLELEKEKIEKEIEYLKREIREECKNSFVSVKKDPNNQALFKYYVAEHKGKKITTFNHYLETLGAMRKMLEENFSICFECNLYEIDDPIVFKKLIDLFESSAKLVSENRNRHHDISAAYNNFYNFLLIKR